MGSYNSEEIITYIHMCLMHAIIIIQMLMNAKRTMEAAITRVLTLKDRTFAVVLDITPLMMINIAV